MVERVSGVGAGISHLSYSSVSQYAECGERWRLSRRWGLGASTWFATVGGKTVHEITEAWDRRLIGLEHSPACEPEDFVEAFDVALEREVEAGADVRASGRVLQKLGKSGGPGRKDADWWRHFGPMMVQNWVDWRQDTSWSLAYLPDPDAPEGSGEAVPAIEYPIRTVLGGVDFVGFADRVFETPNGDLVVVDIKCGNAPASHMQLGVYGRLVEGLLGGDTRVLGGAYWMGFDGVLSEVRDVSYFSLEFVDALFTQARRGIEAGVFLPNVGAFCGSCPVRSACRAVGGGSEVVPLLEEPVSFLPSGV